MKLASILVLVATVLALAGCGETKGDAKPAASGTAAAATAKPAGTGTATGGW